MMLLEEEYLNAFGGDLRDPSFAQTGNTLFGAPLNRGFKPRKQLPPLGLRYLEPRDVAIELVFKDGDIDQILDRYTSGPGMRVNEADNDFYDELLVVLAKIKIEPHVIDSEAMRRRKLMVVRGLSSRMLTMECPVSVQGPDMPIEIMGTSMGCLIGDSYKAIETLVQNFPSSVSKGQFESLELTEAPNTLKRISKRHDYWKRVIVLPGVKGRGYRIRSTSEFHSPIP